MRQSSVLPAVLLFTLFSCSVKEKRCDCPCYLYVDFSVEDPGIVASSVIDVSSEDGFLFDAVLDSSVCSRGVSVPVPRGEVSVNVVAYDGGMFVPGNGLVIPWGGDCPPLYFHHSDVDTSSDSARDTVRLHKSYCAVTVRLLSRESSESLGFEICGNVCGYDRQGSPLGGDFASAGEVLEDGRSLVRIPRQLDSSLRLRVVGSGEVVREFALGEYMSSGGYDWTAPDLEDVDVTVDFALAAVTVKVENWSVKYVYDVEI